MSSGTQVVNLVKGEPYDVYIGRAGKGQDGYFGNPHPIGRRCPICATVHARGEGIEEFKKDFLNRIETDSEFVQRVKELKGKRLGCFCKPHPCHGDVYKEWLDSLPNP